MQIHFRRLFLSDARRVSDTLQHPIDNKQLISQDKCEHKITFTASREAGLARIAASCSLQMTYGDAAQADSACVRRPTPDSMIPGWGIIPGKLDR